jgi:hypothetical protein
MDQTVTEAPSSITGQVNRAERNSIADRVEISGAMAPPAKGTQSLTVPRQEEATNT